jgi:quercetin 2,3-dioxygenase
MSANPARDRRSTRSLRPVMEVVTAHRQLEGGGFPVRRPFPTAGLDQVDPFLLLDEMGPVDWGPGEAIGAPDHPHRGFETVSYILEGEMEHEDSAGHHGVLGPGDVQWMTAGGGIVHSEMPTRGFRQRGGRMHGFQIWVNLPARDKMMQPRYQEVPGDGIPVGRTDDGKVQARVIAGEALGARAVIDTRTPIQYLHFTLQPGGSVVQPVPADHHALVYVFGGGVETDSARTLVRDGQLAFFGDGQAIGLSVSPDADEPAELLLLSGVPLHEPVARWGPFVMNDRDQIRTAISDYEAGRLGAIRRD